VNLFLVWFTIRYNAPLCYSFSNLGIMRQKEKDVAEILHQQYIREYQMNGSQITGEIEAIIKLF